MKLAIMQPYFFPYIGYWQLIHAVDRFVVYDDVNFINRGWINRNRILINGKPSYITVPLKQASQNKKIRDIGIVQETTWQNKLVRTIDNTYRKAPFYHDVFPVIESLINYDSQGLSDYLVHQLSTLSHFMGIDTEFIVTSCCYGNEALSGQERIIDICQREEADIYVNPQNGLSLYDDQFFSDKNIGLRFIVMQPVPYQQKADTFIPYLSIIDTLMQVGPSQIKDHLESFDLLKNDSTHAE